MTVASRLLGELVFYENRLFGAEIEAGKTVVAGGGIQPDRSVILHYNFSGRADSLTQFTAGTTLISVKPDLAF